MRWVSVVVLFLLSISLFYQSSNSLLADVSTIDQLEEFFIKEGLDISSVNVTILTVTDKKQAKAFTQNQKKVTQKNKNITESFNMVYLSDNRVKVIYEFKGADWNKEIKKVLQNRMLNAEFRHFFENSRIYSCFQSRTDVKINSNFMIEKIINHYDVETTNVLDEEKFKVVSGESDQFEQYIPLKNDEINIQFSVREQENGLNTITIGTPILVIEY
ncbi:YwmB family TATA-box binding protein [Piscibacillus salipiscarius]|uniref:YwmB family TATA-box binding protein n=1 Tax=Piscibacillus salipiscarius TaxID=299480 RepID=A0ABW5Q9C4_9BACI